MEKFDHFSHQHSLTFHKSLEAAQLTCTGCNFPCTGTQIYSCRPCKFFLHEQCFNATRTLTHHLHPDHHLSLFQSPTYASRSFICKSCNKSGSGFCFSCTACEFDIHDHCAYNKNDLKSKSKTSSDLPNTVQIKTHPHHPLGYLSKIPYNVSGLYLCDVCGTTESNGPLYHCDICGYDAHVECVDLSETVKRDDHPHALSLLHVNTYEWFNCDVCTSAIEKNNCMYECGSGCNYGIHVKCVTGKVIEKPLMTDLEFQVEMMKIQNKMKVHDMMIDTQLMGTSGNYRNRHYRYKLIVTCIIRSVEYLCYFN